MALGRPENVSCLGLGRLNSLSDDDGHLDLFLVLLVPNISNLLVTRRMLLRLSGVTVSFFGQCNTLLVTRT